MFESITTKSLSTKCYIFSFIYGTYVSTCACSGESKYIYLIQKQKVVVGKGMQHLHHVYFFHQLTEVHPFLTTKFNGFSIIFILPFWSHDQKHAYICLTVIYLLLQFTNVVPTTMHGLIIICLHNQTQMVINSIVVSNFISRHLLCDQAPTIIYRSLFLSFLAHILLSSFFLFVERIN